MAYSYSIVLEGLSCIGKTSQLEYFTSKYEYFHGIPELIHETYTFKNVKNERRFFHNNDRMKGLMMKSVAKGNITLVDRYIYSTIGYELASSDTLYPFDFISELYDDIFFEFPTPSSVIYITEEPHISWNRAKKYRTKLEGHWGTLEGFKKLDYCIQLTLKFLKDKDEGFDIYYVPSHLVRNKIHEMIKNVI